MKRAGKGFLVAILLLAGTTIPVPAGSGTGAEVEVEIEPLPLIDFRIKDQYGKLHTSGSFRNFVTVVVSGDRKGSTFIDQWSPLLEDSLAAEVKSYRVKFIQHAHLGGVPFFIKGKIRDMFRAQSGEGVLLDWGGEFKEAYDLAEDHCSIVVFDRDGRRRSQVAVAEYDQPVFNRVLAGIRGLLE